MEELVDLITSDASASDISDKIKDILFTKTAERIELARPIIASSMFGGTETEETEDQE